MDQTPQAEAYATKTLLSLTGSAARCIEFHGIMGVLRASARRCKGRNELMKANQKLILAVLVGALVGVAGARAIHARPAQALPGYFVAQVHVTDPATFKQYSAKAPGTIAASGGHYIIRGGKNLSIEGDAPKRFV